MFGSGTSGQLLEELGHRAAPLAGMDPAVIVQALSERERLGSTGLGRGFALPHARLAGLNQFIAMFVRLARPVAFDAVDGLPVDLVFLLLVPANAENHHVAALAAISRKMRNKDVADRLRRASTADAAYQALVGT
jgi:PTS system nitrogen regulatory IIA component